MLEHRQPFFVVRKKANRYAVHGSNLTAGVGISMVWEGRKLRQ
ncbi:MAG: hypothetical protein ABJA69_01600 [Acidobacteriaceae bacterium]